MPNLMNNYVGLCRILIISEAAFHCPYAAKREGEKERETMTPQVRHRLRVNTKTVWSRYDLMLWTSLRWMWAALRTYILLPILMRIAKYVLSPVYLLSLISLTLSLLLSLLLSCYLLIFTSLSPLPPLRSLFHSVTSATFLVFLRLPSCVRCLPSYSRVYTIFPVSVFQYGIRTDSTVWNVDQTVK